MAVADLVAAPGVEAPEAVAVVASVASAVLVEAGPVAVEQEEVFRCSF